MVLPIALGIMFAAAHYLSEKVDLIPRRHRMKFVSFSAGIFVTYLILHLFPSLFEQDVYLTRVSLVFVLAGFSLVHLLEKYVYRHEVKDVEVLKKELKEIHSIAFFIYHLVVGIVLVSIAGQLGTAAATLFAAPVFLHTFFSSISLKAVHGRVRQKRPAKILLSLSTLLGVLLAMFFPASNLIYRILFGFIIGAFLYIFLVDSIPRERKGEPMFFILGVALYALLIGATWIL